MYWTDEARQHSIDFFTPHPPHVCHYLARGPAVEAQVIGGDGDGRVRPREEEGRRAPEGLVAEHLLL